MQSGVQCDCNSSKNDDEYTETVESPQATEIKDSPALPEGNGEDAKTYIKLAHYGFSQKAVQALLEVCGGNATELAARLGYGEKRARADEANGKEIASISGYLRTAIVENWLGKYKAEEKAKARELEASEAKPKAIVLEPVEKNMQNAGEILATSKLGDILTRLRDKQKKSQKNG